jgi:hypothetical protein
VNKYLMTVINVVAYGIFVEHWCWRGLTSKALILSCLSQRLHQEPSLCNRLIINPQYFMQLGLFSLPNLNVFASWKMLLQTFNDIGIKIKTI